MAEQAALQQPRARRRGSSVAGRWLANWGPALPLLLLLTVTLVAPIFTLLARSFVTTDGVGLGAWQRVLGQQINQRAILTSLELGLVCATITVLVGTPAAWLVSRMVAGRRAAWLGLLNVSAHFGGIGLAFAYIASLGAFGMVTLLLRGAGIGFDPPARDSFLALVITYEHANIPLFVLLTVPAMGMLRDEWAEAAAASSATRLQFWRRIGIPILAPFVVAGFVLSFTWSIGIFGIAYALAGQSAALPIQLITLQIGQALADDAVRGPERAAVLSVVLLALALGALTVYRLMLARGMRWIGGGVSGATVSSEPGAREARTVTPRRDRLAALILFAGLAVYLCLPIVAVLIFSVAGRWTDTILPASYTLDHWAQTFANSRVATAVINSLSLGMWTTIIVLVLTVPAVYWARIRNVRIRPALELAAAIPFALPFVVIGFAVLQFAGIVAPELQGSYLLLLGSYVAISFPFVYWSIDGAMAAADVRRLSDAAAACGASPWQTIRRVVLPNIRPGLTTAAILAFALTIGEFALVKVLAGSIITIPVWSAGAMNATAGSLAPLSVVTTLVFVALFAMSVAVAYVNRGRLAAGMPGVGEGAMGTRS